MTLYFITGNQNKFSEVEQLVPGIQQLDIDLPEIQDMDPKKIVAAKLLEARKHHDGIIAVEDVSFSLDCMNGFPGPMIKWLLEAVGYQGLYDLTAKYGNFGAESKATVGLSLPNGDIKFFEGAIRGTVVSPTGYHAFGFDHVFQPDGYDQSFAMMPKELKNTISHRALAWGQVREFLQSYNYSSNS